MGFRQKAYEKHHSAGVETPLLRLPIDMVEQFPVGDALHLLHLGIMKRCLLGWRDGLFKKLKKKGDDEGDEEDGRLKKQTIARLSANAINAISEHLICFKLPSEFTRATKRLDDLKQWKGTQFRAFLHYMGIVVLQGRLIDEAYQHFLLLFCATKLSALQNSIYRI